MKNLAALTRLACLVLGVTAAIISHSTLYAQQASIVKLTVEKKPGAHDGRAIATVKGPSKVKGKIVITEKTGHIATHAIQAWTIMNGQAALLLLSPEKKGQPNRLRYYQLDAGKGRMLGNIALDAGMLAERKPADDQWLFALSATDSASKQRVIYAGDTRAIHALVNDAWDPHFSSDSLTYQTPFGKRTVTIAELVALKFQEGIYTPANGGPDAALLEFLPSGEALTIAGDQKVDRGHWIRAGADFQVTSAKGEVRTWPEAELRRVTGIPADHKITLRLLQPLSSLTAKEGMEVKAVSLTPAEDHGLILIPQGTEFSGKIVQAHGVGRGVKHESAALTLHFDSAKLADGRTIGVDALVFKVENAQETVTPAGKIQGIRSTGTLGYSAENKISSLAQIDPIAYIFLSASGPAVLGFAESEILYNAGTELTIVFRTPVISSKVYSPNVPRMDLSAQRQSDFSAMVKELPFRTKTQGTDHVSDITNLIFVGKPDALRRAFGAAGWVTSDQLNAASTFQTVKTLAGNEKYTQAPMSTLLLNGQQPLFTLSKTTNTFSSRHHIRIFPTSESWQGAQVMTASSTQDIGIAFSAKQKTFIHVIDQYLDNERSKVTNDLEFTGCVESIDLLPRPWVPLDAYNSTGDRLRTDGRAAVLFLNDCADPHSTPTTAAVRAGLLERGERDTMLTIKDQLFRGNVGYTGYSVGKGIHNYVSTSGELPQDEGNWRKSDASGTEYRLAGGGQSVRGRNGMWSSAPLDGKEPLDPDTRARLEAHKWDPPRFEIGLNLGYSKYRNNFLEVTSVSLVSSNPDEPTYLIGLGDAVWDGWAAGISLTMNTNDWISNELTYMRQQTKFDLVEFTVSASADPTQQPADSQDYRTVGLVTRRMAYNTVLNFKPRKSRWRPYIDAGPVLQLLSLSDAPLKKPSGYFRLGLSNVGLIKAAFDFGSTPPLNGGGIFQLGLQYGGGIKYRVTSSPDHAGGLWRDIFTEPENYSGQLPWICAGRPGRHLHD